MLLKPSISETLFQNISFSKNDNFIYPLDFYLLSKDTLTDEKIKFAIYFAHIKPFIRKLVLK
jgi:hypothetical protein